MKETSWELYRTIEDREYGILSDEEFAKALLDMEVPTHVVEWLVDAFRKVPY